MNNVPHKPIRKHLLREWGYIPTGEYFVNWNGVYLRFIGGSWEYGNPNYHKVDATHPFIKKGEVKYMDELNNPSIQGDRGLEYKTYSYQWK